MRPWCFSRCIIVCLLIARAASAGERTRPLAIEDALGQHSFGIRAPIDVSGDGLWVAYTVTQPRRLDTAAKQEFTLYSRTGTMVEMLGSDVWVTRLTDGVSHNLTGARGSSWGPVWSPDSRTLAFYSDRDGKARLWLWERDSGKLRRLSEIVVRPFFGFEVVRWASDGRQLLCKALPEGMTSEAAAELIHGPAQEKANPSKGATVSVYRSGATSPTSPKIDAPSAGWTNRYLSDLVAFDVATGSARRLARRVRCIGFWVAPGDAAVAFTNLNSPDGQMQMLFDICVVPSAGGASRVLASRQPLPFGESVSWSPDGQWLAYLTGGGPGPGECYVVAPDGEPVLVSRGPHPSLRSDYRPPLWAVDGRSIYCVADGKVWKIVPAKRTIAPLCKDLPRRALDVLTSGWGRVAASDGGRSLLVATLDNETKMAGFFKIDVAGGRATLLHEANCAFTRPVIFNARTTADGQQVVFGRESAQQPPELWGADAGFRMPRPLSRLNPQFEPLTFGTSRLVHWRSQDGQELRGALLLPAGYQQGQRYPLIVKVYGGEFPSNNVHQFGLAGFAVHNLQLLATRGYAVLLPDVPMREGSIMRDILNAVMPGVDRVVELGIADPERVGVMGHSFGGYSVLALLTQTSRFKAGVMSAGFGDLISCWGLMDKDGSNGGATLVEPGRMGGPPWRHLSRYIENSPAYYLDRVTTPLLILHGSLDDIPIAQAEFVYLGLKQLGREVVFARYEGEDHSPVIWGHDNVIDYWTRIIDWLDAHLRR